MLDCAIAGGRRVQDGRLISRLADGLAYGGLAALGLAPDCRDLLELLAGVSDGRPGQGRDHPVAAVLVVTSEGEVRQHKLEGAGPVRQAQAQAINFNALAEKIDAVSAGP